MDLTQKKCVACEGNTPPLTRNEADALLAQAPGWTLTPDGKKISREFIFPDFKSALAFVDRVGAAAEAEGHHPDVFLAYGMVRIELWTHAVNGLSENDFILAAKINALIH
ncbi:MAG: 4a-hydroxytetrahydrobiopterin dehydratase [bacterium]|nr:4a-hydroxytetrahydrobiopterin dehydratase [bacterium]